MKLRKEISQQLAQDISKLVDIAIANAKSSQEKDRIATLQECIYAGLSDYELAWRGYFGEEEE